jgi:hypothetical protein
MARDEDDDNGNDWPRDTRSPDLAVLADRQRDLQRRVRKLESKQGQVDTLMNKGIGATALLVGVGVLVGWVFAVGGNLVRFFKSMGG